VSELEIVKLVAGGEGLGYAAGKAVFVPGVLPGEKVSVRVVERRRDFERAALLGVLEKSPRRISPPCVLAGRCGGCDWLHIRYEEQLVEKVNIVREALLRTGRMARETIEIEPSPPLGSRHRAQVHRDRAGRLGYMGAGSNHVVPVATCPIVARPIDGIFSGRVPAPEGLERFTVFCNGEEVAVEGIDDDRDLTAKVCGRAIMFSVGCFFQSNPAVLEKLVPWALEGVTGAAAADLYCGVGLFASFLSGRFPRIICVESSAMSLSYARRNVPGTTHEFYPMSVEQWISTNAARGPLDAAIVDPPRPGLGAEVRAWLCKAAPAKLVYVSCNPVTLARDLGALCSGGFVLDDLRLFDFYPQTSHIEAVAKLSWSEKA
jgi:23S rRNA (uracil1939-C5)-methyltransferase